MRRFVVRTTDLAAQTDGVAGVDVAHLNDINLRGVLLGIQAFGRAIRESGGGSIIVTSSGAGLQGGNNMATYCATKFGVIGLVKCGAADLAGDNIRINAVCPGVIDTPILGPVHGNNEMLGLMGSGHPIGRVGQPNEVGQLVAFLASDDDRSSPEQPSPSTAASPRSSEAAARGDQAVASATLKSCHRMTADVAGSGAS